MSTFLKRSLGTATSLKKGTWSFWVKLTKLGGGMLVGNEVENDNNRGYIQINSSDKLRIIDNDTGGDNCQLITTQLFRDTTNWYHFVFAFDTTQSTASDRIKWYVNGERITAFDTETYPAQNIDLKIFEGGQTNKYHIGSLYASGSGSNFFSGLMSHVHFSDGQQLAPTVFGQTDSVTGSWDLKTDPTFTLGNNGFSIFKDDNTITDQSTNSNDFTLGGGTLLATKDNPSNNFATLNPNIIPKNSQNTGISSGNNRFTNGNAIWQSECSAFGVTSGKWYYEVQFQNNSGGDRRFRWGYQIQDFVNVSGNNSVLGGSGQAAAYFATQGYSASYGAYGVGTTQTDLSSDGDINNDNSVYGFALDLDNRKMYGHKDGTYFNSGNPSTGANGIDISGHVNVGDTLFPAFTVHLSNININFGNGILDATALTGTTYNDADGNGIFKYAVPTNYRALCTKGLNQ